MEESFADSNYIDRVISASAENLVERKGRHFLPKMQTPYTGSFVKFRDDGSLKLLEFYKNGVLDGPRVRYGKNLNNRIVIHYTEGRKKRDESFNKGILIGECVFDQSLLALNSKYSSAPIVVFIRNFESEKKFFPNGIARSVIKQVDPLEHDLNNSSKVWLEEEFNQNGIKIRSAYKFLDLESLESCFQRQKWNEFLQLAGPKFIGKSYSFHDNGNILEELNWNKLGMRDGLSFWFYPDGKTQMTFEHKNGFLNRVIEARKLNGHRCNKTKVESGAGKVVYRYGTGEVRAIYNYKKGQRHGVCKDFTRAGKCEYDSFYEYGKVFP